MAEPAVWMAAKAAVGMLTNREIPIMNLIMKGKNTMKSTNKIISLCLSLVFIISFALCISVGAVEAEESNKVEILAQNVVYNEKVSVAYAVDATIEEAVNGEVKVAYYLAADPSKVYEAELLDTTVENNLYIVDNGDGTKTSYPTFATLGFAPQNFTDVVFAVAYKGDSVPADAQYKEYSVAEYLYSRLYKDNFINKTEADGVDYTRKLHYENTLAYGETAQMLLDKNETLITDYSYVYFPEKDGTANGKATGLYEKDTDFAVTYTGTANVAGWNINDGESIVEGTSATVTATGDVMSFMAVANTATPNIVMNPNSTTGTKIEWAEDPAEGGTRDDVIHVTDPGTASADSTNWATVGMDVVDASSNVYVFESDIFIPAAQGNGQELISFSFMAADGTIVSRFFIGVNGDILRIKENNSSVSGNQIVATAQTKGDWFTFKIVLTNGATPAVAISIDGVAIDDANGYLNSYYTANAGKEAADYFQIGFMNQLAVDAYFDNVSYTQGVAAE